MFRALNSFISRLDSDSPSNPSGGFGFQVLRNRNPDLSLEPWFDFVCGINGRQIDDPDSNLFAQEVRNCAGSTVTLGVWSAKGQRFRELHIPVPSGSSSLGVALQWTPLSTTEDVWHILDVAPNSPADQAGLLPYGDYIIGTPEGIVRGEAGLGELVEDHLSRPLRLYVYNHEYNITRELTINPSRHWGGEGALGCVLGFGALHRLPAPLQEPPQAPGETLFESARFSNEDNRPTTASSGSHFMTPYPPPTASTEFLIPAQQFSTSTPPPRTSSRGPGTKHKTRAHHHINPTSAMDEYFKEGEQKSREIDHAPSPKPREGGIAPPPKAGGPPRAGPPPPSAAG